MATLEGPQNHVMLPSSPFTEEKVDKNGGTSNSFDETSGGKEVMMSPQMPYSDTIGTVQTHQVMYDSQKEILNIVQDDTLNEEYQNDEYEDDDDDYD